MAGLIRKREGQGSEISRATEPSWPLGAWDPFRTFGITDPFRRLLSRDPFAEVASMMPTTGPFVPDMEVREAKDAYVICADLPGMREEDLQIDVSGNRLTISGKREEEQREEGERYYTYERSYGSFNRSFTLP